MLDLGLVDAATLGCLGSWAEQDHVPPTPGPQCKCHCLSLHGKGQFLKASCYPSTTPGIFIL